MTRIRPAAPVVQAKEEHVDRLQREITDFLVMLSQQSVTEETSLEVNNLMHVVNDLERIGDHCVHLGRLVQRKVDQRIEFPKPPGGKSPKCPDWREISSP